MSEDINEDNWLYGTENLDSKGSKDYCDSEPENDKIENAPVLNQEETSNGEKSPQNIESSEQKQVCIEDDPAMEMEEQENEIQNEASTDLNVENDNFSNGRKITDEDYSEDDSDDDDINIVIGRIKTGPLYPKQRQNFLVSNVICPTEKKQQSGKFSIEEFESMGSINGVSVQEFSIDSLDEKPWRKPGADITDYFNYGFNEDTWRAYCERQKKIRVNESGVGLQALTATLSGITNNSANSYSQQQAQTPQVISSTGFMTNNRTLTPVSNIEKYPGQIRSRSSFQSNQQIARENTIQVMTAECRDYSKINFGGGHDDSFFDDESYNYGFEPTQDVQWLTQANKSWQPTGIKELPLDPGINASTMDISNHSSEIAQHSIAKLSPSRRISPSRMMTQPVESLMLPPKMTLPFATKDWNKDWERDRDVHLKDKERDMRSRDRERVRENRDRDSLSERERFDRDKSEREWNRERDRTDEKRRSRERSRDRNKEKSEEMDRSFEDSREKRRRDRERDRDREREKSSRRDSSRSREKSKRRSKSYEKSSERKEKRESKKKKEKTGTE